MWIPNKRTTWRAQGKVDKSFNLNVRNDTSRECCLVCAGTQHTQRADRSSTCAHDIWGAHVWCMPKTSSKACWIACTCTTEVPVQHHCCRHDAESQNQPNIHLNKISCLIPCLCTAGSHWKRQNRHTADTVLSYSSHKHALIRPAAIMYIESTAASRIAHCAQPVHSIG